MDTAVAEEPSLGTRMTMMVSVLCSPSSAPALSEASSSWLNGLPWASVRESEPTSRMSVAPSGAFFMPCPPPRERLPAEATSLPSRPTVR